VKRCALLLVNESCPLALEAAEAFDNAVASARLRARADAVGRLELLPADADGLDHAIGRAAPECVLAITGDDVAKTLRSVSPLAKPNFKVGPSISFGK
jgi:hypothetical protein